MAKYSIEDTTLTNIANAIRDKNGETTQYTPGEMPAAIAAIQGGGGSGEEDWFDERVEITLASGYHTGWLSDNSSSGQWTSSSGWKIQYYPIFLKTLKYVNIVNPYNLEKIGYGASATLTDQLKDLIITSTSAKSAYQAFEASGYLTHAPVMNAIIKRFAGMFRYCYRLVDISGLKDVEVDSSYEYSTSYYKNSMFDTCCSLRKTEPNFMKQVGRYPVVGYNSTSAYADRCAYNKMFYYCCALEEITDMGVFCGPKFNITSNMFYDHIYNCGRLKKYTFETNEDGTPIQMGEGGTGLYMANQTLTFSSYVGYLDSTGATNIKNYAGFTEDTRVTDDATYQALKNNPDYWTTLSDYSRYNHDSAVETINSLPICAAGTTNTIKFKGTAGSKTDGGAINTLTEEEIAVAAAKGWTVTLA